MQWMKFTNELYGGGIHVPVRGLRCQDEAGHWRRYRVCTLWDTQKNAFTRRPAQARLIKDKRGSIGVVITGKGGGFVKVGRERAIQYMVITSLDAICKKARQKLLKQVDVELTEHEGFTVAYEKV